MPNPLAVYHQATKSWPAAILLFQIAYWMPKAKVRRGPHLWIAKTTAEWCAETDLTHEQYRTAVAALRQLGLIVTAQHRFAGKTITHLRLTESGGSLVGVVVPGDATTKGVVEPEDATTPGVVVSGDAAPLTGTTPTGTTKPQEEGGVLPHASPPGGKKKQILEEGESEGSEMKAKTALQNLHKADKSSSLEMLWKSAVAEVTGEFIPGLTAKQRGQLKLFVDKCPEGTAVQVIEHTLENWISFTNEAEHEGGAYGSPLKPDVGFLLKYAGIAINGWLTAQKKSKPKAAAPPPVQSTALPPTHPEPAVEAPTVAELYDMMFKD